MSIGYRHLDTADWYHNHDIVGHAMRAFGAREKIYLVTKVYPPNLAHDTVIADTHKFLGELKTNYIDLLLIHWPGSTPVAETLGAMQELQADGVVKSLGISGFHGATLQEVLDLDVPVINNQIEINTKVYPAQTIEKCQSQGITVTSYSPLGVGGLLSNRDLIQIANKERITTAQLILAYLLCQDLIVIPRSANFEHIADNWESCSIELSQDAMQRMDSLVKK